MLKHAFEVFLFIEQVKAIELVTEESA